MPRLALVPAAATLLLVACLQPRTAPRGYNVSSMESDYSPALRLAVTIDSAAPSPDSLVVRIDSGIVVVPGELRAGSAPIMRGLSVSAILAVPAPDSAHAGPLRPWRAIAESAPQPLADSLRYGETQPLGAFRFELPRPTASDAPRAFVLFRVQGGSVSEPVRMADGQVVPGRTFVGGVKVFACPTWSLSGRIDRDRARVMKQRYGAGC